MKTLTIASLFTATLITNTQVKTLAGDLNFSQRQIKGCHNSYTLVTQDGVTATGQPYSQNALDCGRMPTRSAVQNEFNSILGSGWTDMLTFVNFNFKQLEDSVGLSLGLTYSPRSINPILAAFEIEFRQSPLTDYFSSVKNLDFNDLELGVGFQDLNGGTTAFSFDPEKHFNWKNGKATLSFHTPQYNINGSNNFSIFYRPKTVSNPNPGTSKSVPEGNLNAILLMGLALIGLPLKIKR